MVPIALPFGGGPPLVFRLFGLLFVAIGVLNVLRPKEMLAWSVKNKYGVQGDVEPSDTRALVQRIVGAFIALFGVAFTLGPSTVLL
ncbi:DUF6199 family natural product biosynthesis protein [Halomarina rubra]|uniref:DUF6199 family natural product biosynthesis protein n=1 Tax=Halomarina rubra TaxID=2071873 RepID=A0ABD6ARL0_9EURY|nr:DUF6199 family natural product biosynthesis protein [Halomarina rubra]